MVRIDRVYTRGGDKGFTSLGDGSRVSKSHFRVEVCGVIEEANSTLGLLRLYNDQHESVSDEIARIQNELFDLGAELCRPQVEPTKITITDQQVDRLEQEIDRLNQDLTPLTSFVLPGGKSQAAAYSHLARTTVRRAERTLVALAQSEEVRAEVLRYLNRLSDYLFVLGRWLNDLGRSDVLWVPGASR